MAVRSIALAIRPLVGDDNDAPALLEAALALGTGIGSELRHPLGIAIIGGLLLSQLLTLFSTPVIFLAMHDLGQRLKGRRAARAD